MLQIISVIGLITLKLITGCDYLSPAVYLILPLTNQFVWIIIRRTDQSLFTKQVFHKESWTTVTEFIAAYLHIEVNVIDLDTLFQYDSHHDHGTTKALAASEEAIGSRLNS